ncbi:MAG: AmmeMemoRadiSam system radical SAM enzyme [Candidatus Cloacimonetes bacterium HGW-Cloacimonetes-3]|jgi:pyruvate formate lyase activating enzyme|nr:MAG: AmmeMemoRadiSam system radical SAM enzyme [Candidatus Cloacimonetes bacterium HGW-Cloacimonetes-3]
MREALFYVHEDEQVRCTLCPRLCLLEEGQTGFCRGRQVIEGKLMAVNYAKCVSVSVDPIEKKPLFHFHPGSRIVSLGPNSCNLSCAFCQNWEISQEICSTRDVSVQELLGIVASHNPTQVAFTYTEPLMWYEYILDFALIAPDVEIVLVTNAYINEVPFRAMLPHVAAMNIDLKSIRSEFYVQTCGGDIEIVKNNIRSAYEAGVHLEITNLLIPGLNDSPSELKELALYVASIDDAIPFHISGYHPSFKLNIRATRADEVEEACDIVSQYLQRVYAGNVFIPRYSRGSR